MAKQYPERLKQKMRDLRTQGWSLGEISNKSRIPKNTLSGWVKDIKLTKIQKERIKQKEIESAATGRPLAARAIRAKIENWREGIRKSVKHFEKFAFQNPNIAKAICGILYACEGAKYPSTQGLVFTNSDPAMIRFFLNLLRTYFDIREEKLRCRVVYRWDQDMRELHRYWSHVTKIPSDRFFKTKPDERTKGKATKKSDYKGVCSIQYSDTSLQFQLQSIGDAIIKSGAEEI